MFYFAILAHCPKERNQTDISGVWSSLWFWNSRSLTTNYRKQKTLQKSLEALKLVNYHITQKCKLTLSGYVMKVLNDQIRDVQEQLVMVRRGKRLTTYETELSKGL